MYGFSLYIFVCFLPLSLLHLCPLDISIGQPKSVKCSPHPEVAVRPLILSNLSFLYSLPDSCNTVEVLARLWSHLTESSWGVSSLAQEQ